MSAAAPRSAAYLTQIAAMLHVPVEHFSAPRREPTAAEQSPSLHVAALLLDPEGARVAAAFFRMPRSQRVALANTAEAIVDLSSAPAATATGEPR
ncbi:hypothetical protein ABID82_005012 [Methylobacterium sp. PvP062]|uniref:Alkyl hydroperoxide reductase subunit C/ Thiol specific antioxidant domain-containing protein n=1 Tax=Methylobacterium radiotolerans TaxID=31998 RepID=A0ABV2NP37_9HYPH|nr:MULTISPECIES: hypothetical protein [unclassified Methylobacterium]MBP2495003.1 hypothetical protein [Methylobacterium sp. PvP105]MBP2505126.1 hypothetical protein [Methylobacterium sp. PvP109]MCX7336495.1 hypothetical protein [Hyphomicrobiales bacterium]